jgi:hypothetical protein
MRECAALSLYRRLEMGTAIGPRVTERHCRHYLANGFQQGDGDAKIGTGPTFAEGLGQFQGRWLLDYGCPDSPVGVAIAR